MDVPRACNLGLNGGFVCLVGQVLKETVLIGISDVTVHAVWGTHMKSHGSIHDAADGRHGLGTCIHQPAHLPLVRDIAHYYLDGGSTVDFVEELLHFDVLAATSRHEDDVAGAVFDHPARHAAAEAARPADDDVRTFGVQLAEPGWMGDLYKVRISFSC